jgi:hypothetical protein
MPRFKFMKKNYIYLIRIRTTGKILEAVCIGQFDNVYILESLNFQGCEPVQKFLTEREIEWHKEVMEMKPLTTQDEYRKALGMI